jgi:glycerophosphoryl diester phosphodiesterase
VRSVWAYHPVITARLVRACHAADLELIAWTVDDAPRMRELTALGVDGICTNDPRLFADL